MLLFEEKHLIYDDDFYIYELTFDDKRTSAISMREIWWLSPWVRGNGIAPFHIVGGSWKSPSGENVVDKRFVAPRLEEGAPGVKRSRSSKSREADFLENALHKLRLGDEQINKLRRLKLPSVLEPVRRYLLLHLDLSLKREKARYRYLKSGDVGPLRKILFACTCGPSEKELLQQLETASDFWARVRLTGHEWHNKALVCEDTLYPPGYPMSAWNQFIKDYGIREQRQYKAID